MVFFKYTFTTILLALKKNSKIQNKIKLNKKTIEVLLNELFVLDDQKQNERVVEQYTEERDIRTT